MEEGRYREEFLKLNELDDNDYLNELTVLISKIMYERDRYVKNSDNDALRRDFYRILRHKLEDFCVTKKGLTKVELIGCGHTSLAIRIDDKVLKVGKVNNLNSMNQNLDFKCLIPNFYEEAFKISDKEYYTLQLSPMVDTMSINDEDVYEAYKELRKNGYIWNDPTKDNIGRVINDFNFNERIYKAGDIVIIDLEDLAYVGRGEISDEVLEEISMMSYNRDVYNFEVRYTEEELKKKTR